jgi:hypothetical protein
LAGSDFRCRAQSTQMMGTMKGRIGWVFTLPQGVMDS